MKNTMKTMLAAIIIVLAAIILIPSAPVSAKAKVKLKVNKVYAGTKKVSGKITFKKSGYKVKVKIATKKNGKYKYAKKTYKAKVKKKTGKFTVKKLPKLKKGQKVKVTLYKGKKAVKKKVVKVKKKKAASNPLDVETVLKNAKPGEVIQEGDYDKYVNVLDSGRDDYGIKEYVGFQAKNGATLYINTLWGLWNLEEIYKSDREFLKNGGLITGFSDKADPIAALDEWYQKYKPYDGKGLSQIKTPTPGSHQYKVEPGKSIKFYALDYISLPHSPDLFYKVSAYVGDKLVAARWCQLEFNGIKDTVYEKFYKK